jgi:hydrogenase maturation protein HypF
LVVDARSTAAVERLRERKGRWEKPLALMVPDLAAARALAELSPAAERLLGAPEAPILLLPRRPEANVTRAVAPGNPYLGIMLPYTPLHRLLLAELGFPVVATSGNASEEPICIDNEEARERLGSIADVFLMHDRPIVRQVDDSVAMLVGDQPALVRRSRGYAPRPVPSPLPLPAVLALGPQLKCSIALGVGDEVFVSQHVGDLSTPEAQSAHARIVQDFLGMYEASPVAIAHDLHPDYHTTIWLEELAARGYPAPWEALAEAELIGVQHHHAHLAACLAEHGTTLPALGVTWDGTGYGPDGTVWGGEFLVGDAREFRRFAHLRAFRLPGSEASVREPRRALLGLLWELGGDELGSQAASLFAPGELELMVGLLRRRLNAPVTTSAGRLFDAVAALVGLRSRVSFEGQAAMELEFLADPTEAGAYPLPLQEPAGEGLPYQLDWGPLLEALLDERRRGSDRSVMSARFHNALVRGMVAVAEAAGEPKVALTGGCFQNRLLVERARERLERAGFEVLVHRVVPANDGGVSLGQVMVGAAAIAGK